MELVLASGSPFRRQMLAAAGIPCRGVEHGVDERSVVVGDPVLLARALAMAKAVDVAAREPEALVIGADQVVHLDGRRFDKPSSAAEQEEHLRALRGKTHTLVTGVALVSSSGRSGFEVSTRVRFRGDVSDSEIAAYVATGEGRGSAGGYEIEARGVQLAEHIDGSWFNIVGLPLLPLITALREQGWRPSF